MTSKSIKTKPFILEPIGKDYLWGGNRLNEDFHKNLASKPLAESWECSTHADGSSKVGSGELKGQLLKEVIKEHPEFLGTHPKTKGELPVLIKFIDANQDLSIQVHPNDDYAYKNENQSLGKTEMWYVLDANENTELVYGFNHDVSKEDLKESIEQGTINKYLQRVKIKKDDVFYIEAGTVHAIGKGALILEIQENSNITYRLYDYGRISKEGEKRELHVDKALDVANLKSSLEPKQPLRLLKYKKGYAKEFLCRCEYFQVERLLLNNLDNPIVNKNDGLSFEVYVCLEGSCEFRMNDQDILRLNPGQSIFVPANADEIRIYGDAQLLKVTC
ncbi:type I phosphomannose isomerase catalytic subunit [Anaerorhabdus sp.]|uniref:type I phosphomannose isomerase catalytic subunit n=1 Tax=Anaerorhabdus sp. TaxID=1872524 RepID=UPI002FC8D586